VPIRPENKHRYPPNWKDIRAAVLARAEYRCECVGECGLHRGRRCKERHGDRGAWTNGMIVLTTAHLDHNPENNAMTNLKSLCQRCHLRYDREHHAETGRNTRDRVAGQGKLWE